MASLLSHELNQPLAAIASYATGSLNLLQTPASRRRRGDVPNVAMAMRRIAEQAERAGQVIRACTTSCAGATARARRWRRRRCSTP